MIIPIGDRDIKNGAKVKLDEMSTLAIVKYIAKVADEKKADYIKIIDVRSRLIITDYFVILSAKNTRLTKRIEEEIKNNLKKSNLYPINICGLKEGNWILMDYDDFVVHIFTDEYRSYYDLERLWRDSKVIDWS